MAGLASSTYDPTVCAEFEFGVAPSGRAKCRNPNCCNNNKRTIQKGALRIGRVEASPSNLPGAGGRKVPKWVHLECCAPVILQEAIGRYGELEQFPGFSELEADTQTKAVEIVMGILGRIENDASHSDNKKIKKVLPKDTQPSGLLKGGVDAKSRFPVPDILMLVGLPGSGKTTFANRLVSTGGKKGGWDRINQDEMGRAKCEEMARESASAGNRVVLDRCNVQASERREWLNMLLRDDAKQHVAAVFFDFDSKVCIRRVQDRTDHPTIKGGKNKVAGMIVGRMFNRLEPPREQGEGFDKVYTVRSFGDAERLLQAWEKEEQEE